MGALTLDRPPAAREPGPDRVGRPGPAHAVTGGGCFRPTQVRAEAAEPLVALPGKTCRDRGPVVDHRPPPARTVPPDG